jgi:putative exporter of polyketide antibiotics
MEGAMSPRTLFLARLIGLYCILIALAMFVRGQSTVDTVAGLLRDPPLMFVLGVITLAAGLAMVLVHNVWSGGAYLPITDALSDWVDPPSCSQLATRAY